MRDPKLYSVYIMASRSLTLYIGITSDLQQRVLQHKTIALQGSPPPIASSDSFITNAS